MILEGDIKAYFEMEGVISNTSHHNKDISYVENGQVLLITTGHLVLHTDGKCNEIYE